MRMLRRSTLGLILALVGSVAYGEIPDTLGFQGRLNRPGEGPVDGVFSMTVNIYNTNSGGVPLFTEFHSNVAVTKGRFNIELGSVDPANNALSANLDFTEKYFLGLTVAGDSEMTPRLPFNSVAYAQRAAAAAKADEAKQSGQSGNAEVASALDGAAFRLAAAGGGLVVGPRSYVTVTAQCPPGWLVTGGGFSVEPNAPSGILVRDSRPGLGAPQNQWIVRFDNVGGVTTQFQGLAFARCLKTSVP